MYYIVIVIIVIVIVTAIVIVNVIVDGQFAANALKIYLTAERMRN